MESTNPTWNMLNWGWTRLSFMLSPNPAFYLKRNVILDCGKKARLLLGLALIRRRML
jgi:hypothetical protein